MITGTCSGHRQERLFAPYYANTENLKLLVKFLKPVMSSAMKQYGIEKWITGMATGWDTGVAVVCIQEEIPFDAIIPHRDYAKYFKYEDKKRFNEILKHANSYFYCADEYIKGINQERNEALSDYSTDLALVCWDGKPSGTKNFIVYHEGQSKDWKNVWHEWEEFKKTNKKASNS